MFLLQVPISDINLVKKKMWAVTFDDTQRPEIKHPPDTH